MITRIIIIIKSNTRIIIFLLLLKLKYLLQNEINSFNQF